MAAPHLVLLPGMMCDERLFEPQINALNMPCTVADLSGHQTIEALAEHVLEEAPLRFALAGLSMGGIVAFELWRQAPDRITHLALMDTNPHPDAPERRTQRWRQVEEVLKGNLRDVAVDSLKPFYLAEQNREDDDLLGVILSMAMDLGPQVFERQSRALSARPDSVPILETITCPTLVLCGREDRLCPLDYHALMAERVPRATLCVVEGSGHLPTLEQPDAVTAAMRSWLASD
ncbi:MAG: alpha/beta hydrolase [Pseudomonadota bacterium]